MTVQMLSAAEASQVLVSEPVAMDDISEARRWEEMHGLTPDNPEGLSNDFDELDRDAFGGVLG